MAHKKTVKKAIKGNAEAFELLINEQREKLYKTAWLYVRNKEDALDIVQEAVTKAFVSLAQLKKPELFNAWLMKILIHTAYDVLQKKKKVVLTDDFSNFQRKESIEVEEKIDLISAITNLDYHYRTAIILFYFHDQSIHTISEIMDKPEGTIKTYLRRAKGELKKVLGGVNIDEKRLV
ncbi:sigma-70 family RNA polymerase sigma factor [Halobacillus litoralis]|uniref:Sigma-70 family RNA polymerase sigma factor n=1 Tax=Halobacillus litoralis TaxID=45668 RepID=A0A845FEZ9_9BACI|nr:MULTISPECIES: sigma-70 family RNA polymerase sigma factor [Halobacillus]ELK46097.1 RNA polymerase sigma factor [Halobacillus sp. BAB-2008]MBX0359554.1 sigma-70 family RNA polymerase sigma factor [Halobacillus sp. Nhm2S1]MYL73112.1 sigma-70 family RNA polymerase sigma factor [Halobacillus litoralis]